MKNKTVKVIIDCVAVCTIVVFVLYIAFIHEETQVHEVTTLECGPSIQINAYCSSRSSSRDTMTVCYMAQVREYRKALFLRDTFKDRVPDWKHISATCLRRSLDPLFINMLKYRLCIEQELISSPKKEKRIL